MSNQKRLHVWLRRRSDNSQCACVQFTSKLPSWFSVPLQTTLNEDLRSLEVIETNADHCWIRYLSGWFISYCLQLQICKLFAIPCQSQVKSFWPFMTSIRVNSYFYIIPLPSQRHETVENLMYDVYLTVVYGISAPMTGQLDGEADSILIAWLKPFNAVHE